MGEMFGDWISDEWIYKILRIVRTCQRQHIFLFLTKNPKRYLEFKFPDNCWLGTTITNNHTLAYKSKNESCFISCEPLLEDIKGEWLKYQKWIIIGALNCNGKVVSPDKGGTQREWVRNLILTAQQFNVPLFIKDSLLEMVKNMVDDKYELDIQKFRELPYLKKGVTHG